MATPATIPKQAAARNKSGNTAFTRYANARDDALAAFAKHSRIQPLWRALTAATDALLVPSVQQAGLTLVAVGGYGRRELFPFSDVDVLILTPPALGAAQEEGIVQALHALWDAQVPVSHATRSVADTLLLAQKDATVCAALMDARYLAGDRKQYLALKRGLKTDVFGKQPRVFVEAKLAERDQRHARYGDSRFMLQPHVKEGKGGLRDLQTLNWLTRYCYGTARAQDVVQKDMLSAQEWKHYRQAYLFFATVRAMLHVQRNRADDRLSFDMQPGIAQALGFRGKTNEARAERLMLRYFQYTRAVGNMTRILCATLEEQQLRAQPAPFVQENVARSLPDYLCVDHGRLHFSATATLEDAPHQVVGLFAAAQEHGLDIHPRAQLQLSRLLPRMGRRLPVDGESNRLLLQILLSHRLPEVTLRRMNEMGVLPAIIPEFGRLSGQMQYDGYHTYTVDEHILVAIGNLRGFETGVWRDVQPLATSLAGETHDRRVLFVAMLCHDIGKGRGGGHADKGAHLAQLVASRLGLNVQESTLVGWLVQQHSIITDTAFKRDLDDPQTIADFVAEIQSPERLRLLLLLTVADIRAVGPTIFNGWKGSLMRTLYQRAMAAMGAGSTAVAPHALPQDLVEQWRAAPAIPAIAISHDAFQAVTEITICMATAPRMLTALAGVLTAVGASIVSARIRPLAGDNSGGSLAEFHVQSVHNESFADDARRLQDLPQRIVDALADPDKLTRAVRARKVVRHATQELPVRAGVFIDNLSSGSASVVEVNARDRVGLLYHVLQAMDQCGLQVMTAHINTYGALAVDVFYVKDAYGHKITHHARQAQLQQVLRPVLGEEEQ